jgi:prolyl 4-hydroxylase
MQLLRIISILIVISSAQSEFYSSIDKMKALSNIENEILDEFQDISTSIDELKRYFEQKVTPWREEKIAATGDIDAYVTNPLNAFLMLKRNVYDLKMVTKKIGVFAGKLRKNVKSIKEKSLVEEREVVGAVGGMIRAQRAYQLQNEDLVEGIVDGSLTRKPLSPHDIFILGKSANNRKEHAYFVKSFLKIAEEKIGKGEDFLKEVNTTEIPKILGTVTDKVLDPFDETYTRSKERNRFAEIFLVQKTCRGNLTRTPKETKHLRCRMVSFTPFSKIGPFKLEEASIEPYIVVYHEVLSDKESDHLIALARKDQSRATLGKKHRDWSAFFNFTCNC